MKKFPTSFRLTEHYKRLRGKNTLEERLALLTVKSIRASNPLRRAEKLLLKNVESGVLTMGEARLAFRDLLQRMSGVLIGQHPEFGKILSDATHGGTKTEAAQKIMQIANRQVIVGKSDVGEKRIEIVQNIDGNLGITIKPLPPKQRLRI